MDNGDIGAAVAGADQRHAGRGSARTMSRCSSPKPMPTRVNGVQTAAVASLYGSRSPRGDGCRSDRAVAFGFGLSAEIGRMRLRPLAARARRRRRRRFSQDSMCARAGRSSIQARRSRSEPALLADGEVVVMSARWESGQLLQPITADQPCGENLEDTELLASFDTFRLFGQAQAARRPGGAAMRSGYRSRRSRRSGSRFATRPLEALAKSKDLRLLAHPGNGVAEDRWSAGIFRDAERRVSVAGDVLEPDVSARRRGCHSSAERAELLRRSDGRGRRAAPRAAGQQPAARHVQPPRHRHRDASAAAGRGRRRRSTKTRSMRRSRSMPLAELTRAPRQRRRRASRRCSKIDATMRDAAGSEATPNFDPLTAQLARMSQVLRAQLASHPAGAPARCRAAEAGGRRRRRGIGGRRHQVAAGCDPGAGRGGGVFQAHRAVEPDSVVSGACEASGLEGFSRSAGRHRAGGGRAGTGGGRVETGRVAVRSFRQEVVRGQVKQSEVHRAQSRASRADRVRRRAVRRGEEDSAALRHGRARRSVGQAGGAAGAGRRSQVSRHRRRQLRQPHEGAEAACSVSRCPTR